MAWTLTVSELNDYVRRTLAGDPTLRFIYLHGEISDFKQYASGHWYFTLKDEKARISCVCFAQYARLAGFTPQSGMKVTLYGGVGLYPVSGTYQFYAEKITRDGVGELYLKYEALKARLMQEGLFDVTRKRPLPLLPRAIGVVTSRSGAVIHDIATVTRRRCPGMQIILRPAQVQGEGAAEDIAQGIAEIAKVPGVDVVIIGRGGGSMEDLWAFNEETVVRAIAACPLPVVSAVGHEVDVTLSDLAADVRAATPSMAAEICVPERDELRKTLANLQSQMRQAAENAILSRRAYLINADKRLAARHPLTQLRAAQSTAALLTQRMTAWTEKKLTLYRADIERLSQKVSALGPRQALSRGYAIVLRGKKPVTHAAQASGRMTLVMQDGTVEVDTAAVHTGFDPLAPENGILK